MANAWDRIRNPLPAPDGHASASAQDRRAGPRLPCAAGPRAGHASSARATTRATCSRRPAATPTATATTSSCWCRRRASRSAASARAGSSPNARRAWSALAPQLPVPMREPIAEAAIAPGAVVVGSTDARRAAADPRARGRRAARRLAGVGRRRRRVPEARALGGRVRRRARRVLAPGEPRPQMAVPAPRFDAFGAALVADALGNARTRRGRARAERPAAAQGRRRARRRGRDVRRAARGRRPRSGRRARDRDERRPARGGRPGRTARRRDRHRHVVARLGLARARSRPARGAPATSRARRAACARSRCARPGDHGEPALVAVVGSEVWIVRAGIAAARRPDRGASRRKARDDRAQAAARGIGGGAGVPRDARGAGARPHAVRDEPDAARALADRLARPAPHRRRDGRVLRRSALRHALRARRERGARPVARRGGPAAGRRGAARRRSAPASASPRARRSTRAPSPSRSRARARTTRPRGSRTSPRRG